MLEWLALEGGIVFSWWALVTLAGAAALPLCLRLLGGLPDRGYTLARAVGLLLVGFVFWLLAMFGFISNTPDSMILAWLIVLLISGVLFASGERIDLLAWWRENRAVIGVSEILFALMLIGWAFFRAQQNSLLGTEKPMELAFLSSVMHSASFPPADPWLSGYAISYYYFGYVIMGMLSTLSGITSAVGFNMSAALLFALTGLSAFGVAYNLARSRALDAARQHGRAAALAAGALGLACVALLGNFQLPLVELPYQTGAAEAEYLAIWNLNERQTPVAAPRESIDQWSDWWWFRSARVISDRGLNGAHSEVIDEFPAFSFVLSDIHPHVLALPFAALAVGLALNIVLMRRRPTNREIVFYALVTGGLIFLNTWDGPIYMVLLVGAEALRRVIYRGAGRISAHDWGALLWFGARLVVLSVMFYLPFLITFRSQAAGIAPNLINPTSFGQFFLMFAPLLLLTLPFLGAEAARAGARLNWRIGWLIGGGLLLALIAVMLIFGAVGLLVPDVRAQAESFALQHGGWEATVADALLKRLTHFPTALLLTLMIVLAAARLFPRYSDDDAITPNPPIITYAPSTGFALLLIAAGAVLILTPEFIFLLDNFGTRMNTVFKFYYQAWLLISLAAAYGAHVVFTAARAINLPLRAAYGGITVVVLLLGLMFPVLATHHRARVEFGRSFSPQPITLDGAPSFIPEDDYQAVLCLQQIVGDRQDVVVAEAVGGQYDGRFGRTGTLTGIPVVLNWAGHQAQWRGATYSETVGTRDADINLLYSDPTWDMAQRIIRMYRINFIFFGAAERQKYANAPAAELKFRENLPIVCEFGGTRVYQVPEHIVSAARE